MATGGSVDMRANAIRALGYWPKEVAGIIADYGKLSGRECLLLALAHGPFAITYANIWLSIERPLSLDEYVICHVTRRCRELNRYVAIDSVVLYIATKTAFGMFDWPTWLPNEYCGGMSDALAARLSREG